jgi:hypothetical protein
MQILHYTEPNVEDIHCVGFKTEADLISFMITLTDLHHTSNNIGWPAFLLVFDPERMKKKKDKDVIERARKHFLSIKQEMQGTVSDGTETSEASEDQVQPEVSGDHEPVKSRRKTSRRKGRR